MQEGSERLDRRDHAGHDILTSEQAPGFRLEARPGTAREFTQQLAIEARVNSQTLGDGQDDLSMCHGRADSCWLWGRVDAANAGVCWALPWWPCVAEAAVDAVCLTAK